MVVVWQTTRTDDCWFHCSTFSTLKKLLPTMIIGNIDYSHITFAEFIFQHSFTGTLSITYLFPTVQHFQHFLMETTPFLGMHRSNMTVVYASFYNLSLICIMIFRSKKRLIRLKPGTIYACKILFLLKKIKKNGLSIEVFFSINFLVDIADLIHYLYWNVYLLCVYFRLFFIFFTFFVNLWKKSIYIHCLYVIKYYNRGPAKKTRCTRRLASKPEIITGQFWNLLAKILIIKSCHQIHSLLY